MNSNIPSNEVKKLYSQLILTRELSDINEEAAKNAGRELSRFGSEATSLITKRLKRADALELRKLLVVIKHMDHRGMDESLIHLLVNRVIPLDLKMDFFREMSQMGISLDQAFLQQLHEADELYLQLSGQLKNETESSILRALELAEDFFYCLSPCKPLSCRNCLRCFRLLCLSI